MRILLLSTLVLFSFACKEEEKKEMQTAAVKVQLSNDTTSLALTESTGYPDKLEITVLYIRILETDGNDGSVGLSSFIYINPDCRLTADELTTAQEEAPVGYSRGSQQYANHPH